jgi:protocatechuate 3,4-dioxygenase beta subunit
MTSTLRRRLIGAVLILPVAGRAFAQGRPATCGELTRPQTAGPFFTPNSPLRASLLEKDAKGTRLVLTGTVLSPQCQPVPNALLDFWQADDGGEYDNRGFRYRGHQFADAQGRYRLETVVPGEYSGRTPHIHVRVQAPGSALLTTQLYFPAHPRNRRDFLYRPELEMRFARQGEAAHGEFDFVIEA